MSTSIALPTVIKLLANDIRWSLLQALTVTDLRVQELSTLVNEPMNLVSYHLKKLRQDDLVTTRRSEADGRDLYYSLDVGKLRTLYQEAAYALHPAMSSNLSPEPVSTTAQPLRVLFVCTHNAARSQMAEALLRHKGVSSVEVFSAGNTPTEVHPDTVSTMEALGISLSGQYAKSLEGFVGQSFGYVITVCDKAREACPTFPGGKQLHWGFADPLNIQDEKQRHLAFERIAGELSSRIEYFLIEQQV
jgi:ArsR family transcriptional regulator, arsenate/arsenite/antimonite-responsive transcriptional repressor / arsenate reductase (thioredoxin)